MQYLLLLLPFAGIVFVLAHPAVALYQTITISRREPTPGITVPEVQAYIRPGRYYVEYPEIPARTSLMPLSAALNLAAVFDGEGARVLSVPRRVYKRSIGE